MIVLGIDTSCDDTGIGIVKNGKDVLANIVSSQVKIHRRYGGVIPELASREHLKNFIYVLEDALCQANINIKNIDLIAVTEFPGLPGALLTGLMYAKTISYVLNKPIVFLNHIHSHISAVYLTHKNLNPPFFSIVISGGHTSMIDVVSQTKFIEIGKTRDDAAGEAFDKVGNMLKLGYPGGIEIEKISMKAIKKNISFTRPFLENTPDFSFSGIKTQVLYFIQKQKKLTKKLKAEIAYGFSAAVTDVLVNKTILYAKKNKRNKIVIAGGVASNNMLRKKFKIEGRKNKIEIFFPEKKFCTDNGAMVAAYGYYFKKLENTSKNLQVQNYKL